MSGLAILCSGQGGQGPDMFEIAGSEPEAEPIFAAAAVALGGRDPRDLARQGDAVIHRNAVAQMLCATASLAVHAAIGAAAARPVAVAGYSAGEVPSWAVAGVLEAACAFRLITRRAELMDAVTRAPSGLAAITGLPRPVIDALCRAYGLDVAIIDGPAHFVVGGLARGVEAAVPEAEALGATRAAMLPVHVASHTSMLRPAGAAFLPVLEAATAGARLPQGARLISGLDGTPVRNIQAGLAKLASQVFTTIDWASCMDSIRAARPSRILELGPGAALAHMMREAAPAIPTRSASDFRTIEGLRSWLSDA